MRPKRCDWRCPVCRKRCGGIREHGGVHQCPVHYQGHVLANATGDIFDALFQIEYIGAVLSRGEPAVRVTNRGKGGAVVKQVIGPEKLDEFRELIRTYGCSITMAAVWLRLGVVEGR